MVGMEDFFTSGRRIKNQEPQKEKTEDKDKEVIRPTKTQMDSQTQRTSQVEVPRRVVEEKNVPTSTGSYPDFSDMDEEERKRYPERTFDRFIQKGARLRAEDIDLLKVFCSEITRAKRLLPYEYRSNKRVTDNTILRLLLQSFCEKIEDRIDTIDFKGLQSEGDLKRFIEEVMQF